MARIALVVPALDGGGGVPSVADFLCRAIERSGRHSCALFSLATAHDDPHSVQLASPASWLRGVTARPGVWHGRPFLHVGAVASEFEFRRYQPRAVLASRLRDIDLVQVVSGSPAAALAVSRLGKPVVLQVATRAIVERRQAEREAHGAGAAWRRVMTRVTDRLDDLALRRVDAVMVENPWMLAYARAAGADLGVRVRYAPPGVDTGWFSPAPEATPGRARPDYILSVGRFSDPRKNVGLLVDAYGRLRSQGASRARLVLAGASPPPAAVLAQLAARGLAGEVDIVVRPDAVALRELYRGATCFALSSDEEGFGMVLLESMACGTPAVATRCGGPDGIIRDGHDGFLVDNGDAAALAARLECLTTQPATRWRMGQHALETARQRFCETVTGRAFLDMYDELLGEYGVAARRVRRPAESA
jgi:glycosyltransferase involved in cell wall biosynthesis